MSQAVYARLREDLATAQKAGRLALSSTKLAARLVTAMGLQAAEDLGHGRIDARAIPDVVRAILRGLGCTPDDAAARSDEAARDADNFAHQLAAADEADLPGG